MISRFLNVTTKKRAFTLIELMVVISIIGLLSSIIFISFNHAKKRARDTEVITNLTATCKALEAYYIENGHYPYVGCSFSGEDVSNHYGKFRDYPEDNNKIFDILQSFLFPDIVKPYIPNDPDAPNGNWSYFYDNYYDNVSPENTPGTTECNNQAFQLLGYMEVNALPFEWDPVWGTWEGHGWWRACSNYY